MIERITVSVAVCCPWSPVSVLLYSRGSHCLLCRCRLLGLHGLPSGPRRLRPDRSQVNQVQDHGRPATQTPPAHQLQAGAGPLHHPRQLYHQRLRGDRNLVRAELLQYNSARR